jgi:hypothetical protein
MNNHYVTQNNINAVRDGIAHKLNYNVPFYGSIQDTSNVITDQDHFPYNRYFRGVYNESKPIVFEREAGWRPRNDACYKQIVAPTYYRPKYCWEGPCSTIYPCDPEGPVSAPASFVRLPGDNVIFPP